MLKRLLIIIPLCFIFALPIMAQRTVGTISYNPAKAYDGYNLLYPHNQPNVYLLDNCGRIVHVWEDDPSFRPANTAYIQENGNLVKTKRSASVAGDPIWAGGGGATVEIRSWENDLLWTFTINDSLARLHHDIEPLPNGNILMLVWENKSAEEAIQAGRDTSLLPDGELWPDYLIEVEPVGTEDYNIVWEWHIWDHLVQDYDSTKDNFGVVEDSPQKMDINYTSNDGGADWMHSNAIDYNADLDQILISIPFFDEVWIIDHSTTTEQATGSTGGQAGRGGDILYRWGNPAVYRAGTAENQTLFFNHDAHWVDEFLDFSHPDYGKIAVFNNRVGDDYSTVNIFATPFDMYSWSYPMSGSTFGPDDFDWTAVHPVDSNLLWSTGLSSLQVLPNGNTLICVGRFGYVFELTPDNEIVWEYKTPLLAGNPVTQGDTLVVNNNLTFRVTRYPADFVAFDGIDLEGTEYIELEPDLAFCTSVDTELDNISQYKLQLFPNPAKDLLIIEWEGGLWVNIEIYDVLGRRVEYFIASGGRKYHDISHLNQGLYYVKINQSELQKLIITR